MAEEMAAPTETPTPAPAEENAEIQETLETPEAIEAAKAEAKKAEEAAKSFKKKFTPKVNGKQKEIEIDLGNDEEVLKYVQKAMASDEKFQEAASMRKQMESFINELKSNPLTILKHPELGLDIKKMAEQILNEELEEMSKSPEQKEKEKLQKEIEALRKKAEEAEQAKQQAELEKVREQEFVSLEKELTSALSTSTLPKSPYVVKRIADALLDANKLGYEDVKVADILPIVESQIRDEIQSMFGAMPEEVMEQIIGKNNLSRLRNKRIQKKAAPTAAQIKPTGQAELAKQDDKKEADKVKFKDLFGTF